MRAASCARTEEADITNKKKRRLVKKKFILPESLRIIRTRMQNPAFQIGDRGEPTITGWLISRRGSNLNCRRKKRTQAALNTRRSRHTGDVFRYFSAIVPTSDSKILNPSVPPSSASAARSGCGIIPNTLRPGLQIPAIFSSEPLGLASAVTRPSRSA